MADIANGYQVNSGFSANTDIVDGSDSTGYEYTSATNNSVIGVTARVDLGSAQAVGSIEVDVKYTSLLDYSCDYSSDGTTWTNIPDDSVTAVYDLGPNHFLTYSLETGLVCDIIGTITARYWRICVQDDQVGNEGAGNPVNKIGLFELRIKDGSGSVIAGQSVYTITVVRRRSSGIMC